MRSKFTKNIHNIVVKVGTSVLTAGGKFDRRVLTQIASQVSRLLNKGVHVSLVSSGAIGAGMTILKMKKRPQSMEALQGAAAVGQRYLMQCYEEAFSKKKFSTAQMLLTWDDLTQKKRFLNAKRTLKEIQKWGLVPIVNENDTVATDEIRFGDNDKLSSLLSILVGAEVLVILSNIDGLYANNASEKKGSRIKIVEKMETGVFSHVRDKANSFTVGGMRSKLEAIRISVQAGIPVFLADGRQPNVLDRIFNGEDVGTFFLPEGKKRHRRNDWVSHFLSQLQNK